MTSKYPELPPEVRRLSLWGMLKIFGPGAIIASVTIGSGETVFPSRNGAIFGYSLLWCFVLGTFIKGFQIYSGARFMTLTGRHPLESWSELPGPRGWFVWCMTVLSLFCMPLFLGGVLPRMLADFMVSGVMGVTTKDPIVARRAAASTRSGGSRVVTSRGPIIRQLRRSKSDASK